MKAIPKSNRKVIVDVEVYKTDEQFSFLTYPIYVDKNNNLYEADELDWVEYYGG